MRIDPARLSRLLLALGQKTETARSGKTDRSDTPTAASGRGRDLQVLRKDIRGRLKALDPDAADYDSTAASITIQEILRWEFGADILDQAEFHRIAASIAASMLEDARMAASLRKLARDLAG